MSVLTQTPTVPTLATERSHKKNAWGQPPDITYTPDHEKWLKRTTKRLTDDPTLSSTPLSEEFPQKLEGPLVWEGKDWKNESQWIYDLAPAELKEIDDAVHHFNGKLTPVTANSYADIP